MKSKYISLLVLAIALIHSPVLADEKMAIPDLTLLTSKVEGFSELTPAQQARIVSDIAGKSANFLEENKKAEQAEQAAKVAEETVKTTTAEKVDKWVDVGVNIGKGLSGAAKETNIAVNEFAQTPVGILTTILIVWHFMGNGGMIAHFLGGFTLLIVGHFSLKQFAKQCSSTKETVENGVVTSRVITPLSGEAKIGFAISKTALLIVFIITIFSY